MKIKFTLLLCVLSLFRVSANNIQVSSVTLNGKDLSAGLNNAANSTMVQFDLSWENSWRINNGASNWDAAWVFVKYRTNGGRWQHAWLSNTGHTAASGSTIDIGLLNPGTVHNAASNPGLGAFVYRNAPGYGNNTFSSMKLRWNHGAQGIPDNAIVDVQVFAIEMVYVAQGSFQLGDGTVSGINGQFRDGAVNIPLTISSEAALTLGGTASGSLSSNNNLGITVTGPDDFDNTTTQTLPASYPKGFNAFYCMKFELSIGQYRDFLNMLTYTQQKNRTTTAPNNAAGTGAIDSLNRYRNGLDIMTPGVDSTTPAVYACNLDGDNNYNESNDGEWIACNYISYMNTSAFYDWAALRPMTELEFEKACRGPLPAVIGELAWGSTSITTGAIASLTNSGAADEVLSTANANIYLKTVAGDSSLFLRVGSFATNSTSRLKSGATYWGILDMSGNVWERTICVGNTTGRAFTGLHGNGMLSNNGCSNVLNWPGIDVNGEITGDNGTGVRGGTSAGLVATAYSVSRRSNATPPFSASQTLNPENSCRAVRKAP
jgi:formylglycine-generating enzyme required for sulfatase activity